MYHYMYHMIFTKLNKLLKTMFYKLSSIDAIQDTNFVYLNMTEYKVERLKL